MSLPRKAARNIIHKTSPMIRQLGHDLWEATRKDSDGGRTITRAEYNQLRKSADQLLVAIMELLGVKVIKVVKPTRKRTPKEEAPKEEAKSEE